MNKEAVINFFSNNSATSDNNDDVVIDSSVNKQILDNLGLEYKKITDGFKITKKQGSNIYFFIDFDSCIGNLKHKKNDKKIKEIFIVEKRQFYSAEEVIDSLSIQNKLIDIINSKHIADYRDEANQKLIFLSDTIGRVDISLSHVGFSEIYFQSNNNLSNYVDQINEELNHIETQSIFKDCIVRLFTQNPKIKKNIHVLLSYIDCLYEDFYRNINLYKSQYTFDKFLTEFDKKKEEYIKHYTDFFSSIVSKLYAIPIQIGGYVFLLSRTSDETLWTIVALSVIIFVGFFTNFIYGMTLDNTEFFKSEFDEKTTLIKDKLKLQDDKKFNKDVEGIKNRVLKILNALKVLKWLNILISLLFLLICLYKLIC